MRCSEITTGAKSNLRAMIFKAWKILLRKLDFTHARFSSPFRQCRGGLFCFDENPLDFMVEAV